MKNYDPKMAARVWERVQQTTPQTSDANTLLNLIEQTRQDAATYQKLSRKLPPPQAAVLRQLATQEQAGTDCLKGIYALQTGGKAIVPTAVPADTPVTATLRTCYGREMGRLAQYEARQTDPQYGHIYRQLAQQEQAHCHKLLELLGVLTK